jgi:peptidyl-prolyl cis-trans isomerase A (cyclophilin A)
VLATSNVKGTLTFASSGKNSRSNQLFFNLHDNGYLDKQGFSPIGRITQGIELLDKIYTGYGDKPNQGKINSIGNSYLAETFPELTYMESVRIVS